MKMTCDDCRNHFHDYNHDLHTCGCGIEEDGDSGGAKAPHMQTKHAGGYNAEARAEAEDCSWFERADGLE